MAFVYRLLSHFSQCLFHGVLTSPNSALHIHKYLVLSANQANQVPVAEKPLGKARGLGGVAPEKALSCAQAYSWSQTQKPEQRRGQRVSHRAPLVSQPSYFDSVFQEAFIMTLPITKPCWGFPVICRKQKGQTLPSPPCNLCMSHMIDQ